MSEAEALPAAAMLEIKLSSEKLEEQDGQVGCSATPFEILYY